MRKYVLSLVLISAGILIFIYNLINTTASAYAETAFAEKADQFEHSFENFTDQIKQNIYNLKIHFSDSLNVLDTIRSRDYCFDQLKKNKALTSIGIFRDDHKILARKENTSFIYAVDNSPELDVVKWQRFEKDKLVSSWYESFEESNSNAEWISDLLSENDQIKWNLRADSRINPKNDQDFFYIGYSYTNDNASHVIILEYSRELLLSEFNIASLKAQPRLSITNLDGKELLFNGPKIVSADGIKMSSEENDSLEINISSHFSKFRGKEQGNFKFRYKDEIYWNSFKKISEDAGIRYFLFTIPDSQLKTGADHFLKGYLSWIALTLIFIGVLLLSVRNRFFYKPNKMEIPSVKKILEDDENRYLEFKSSLRWDYRQEKVNPELEKIIMKTIAAFGNTDGGILMIGIDDDKNILGIEKDFKTLKKSDADYYEVHLRNLMHKMMGVKYVSKFIRTQFETVGDEKTVCKIKVLPANEPLYLKFKNKNGQTEEKFFVRSGNSSHEIESIAEINDYINTKFKKR